MNIRDFFRSAAAFHAVFKLGFMPKKEEFYELTPEQYKKYYEAEKVEEVNEKIFMLLPNDVKKYNEIAAGKALVFSERDISHLLGIEQIIDEYCAASKKTFKTFEDKLYHVADMVPDSFTAGTKFAKAIDFKSNK
jgi:hypothetical protein